jgi:hypothetical protein
LCSFCTFFTYCIPIFSLFLYHAHTLIYSEFIRNNFQHNSNNRLKNVELASRPAQMAMATLQAAGVERGRGLWAPAQYRSIFSYEFPANGSRYAGFFAAQANDEEEADALQKQATGTGVTVRYDRENRAGESGRLVFGGWNDLRAEGYAESALAAVAAGEIQGDYNGEEKLSSGAKALRRRVDTWGLKPLPPKEKSVVGGLDAGPQGPTP